MAELTDNRFQIRAFSAGEIAPPLQVLDAVQNGTIECGQTALYYYIGKDPALSFFTSMPFGGNYRQQGAWMKRGGGNEIVCRDAEGVQLRRLPLRRHRHADGRLVPATK